MAGLIGGDCKTVKIISGSKPGGTTDTLARDLATSLMTSKVVGTAIVENKTGAAGQLAASTIATSGKCDVYMANAAPLSINQFTKKAPAPESIMTPVGMVAKYPNLFTVGKSLAGAKDFAAVVEMSKKAPLRYGTSGVGSINHLAMEKLKEETGLVADHIPYNGSNEAALALAAGTIDIVFDGAAPLMPLYEKYGFRMVGASTGETADTSVVIDGKTIRVPALVYKGKTFAAHSWIGLVGSKANANAAVVKDMNAALNQMLTDPAMKAKYEGGLGINLTPSTPEALGKYMQTQAVDWQSFALAHGKDQ